MDNPLRCSSLSVTMDFEAPDTVGVVYARPGEFTLFPHPSRESFGHGAAEAMTPGIPPTTRTKETWTAARGSPVRR